MRQGGTQMKERQRSIESSRSYDMSESSHVQTLFKNKDRFIFFKCVYFIGFNVLKPYHTN